MKMKQSAVHPNIGNLKRKGAEDKQAHNNVTTLCLEELGRKQIARKEIIRRKKGVLEMPDGTIKTKITLDDIETSSEEPTTRGNEIPQSLA